MAGTYSSSWGRLGLFLCALAALMLLAISGHAPAARAASCPPIPGTLAPNTTNPAARFTMMLRVQSKADAETYASSDPTTGGLARMVRPQDIFLINTRFQNSDGTSSPAVQSSLVLPKLRAAFPCNRIVALTGLGSDPTQPGYAYALADQGLWALMTDWEVSDWTDAQPAGTPLPPFSYDFATTLPRMRGWAATISSGLLNIPGGAYSRVGMIPIDQGRYWNYGQVGQKMDRVNQRLGGLHAGVQSVMTQASCTAGPASFGARVKLLTDQYTYRTIYIKRRKFKGHGRKRHRVTVRVPRKVKIPKKKRANPLNLAVQISFVNNPTPGDPMPIVATGPTTADQCVAAGLARGASTFFFYASTDSMRALFAQPTVASLRPPV